MEKVTVGIAGVGGWGKNLVRNYSQIPSADLRYICDLDHSKLEKLRSEFLVHKTTTDFDEMLADEAVDAVIIATTAPTHFDLCRKALIAGKDVYVEKPMVLSANDALKLVDLAKETERILMVGHLLEYHPVVSYLKSYIRSGELGDVRYIYSQRLNLGTVRPDENALWSFAPHDISVILYLLGLEPTDVAARGQAYLQEGIEDTVFLTLNFAGQSMGHVHVSWLDPHKIRRITIVGSKRMAVFDDLEPTEKLKIYDKGAEVNTDYDSFAEYIGLRFGDITIPHIRVGEPLRIECEHFLDCVRTRTQPLSDGLDGYRVTRVLESASESLRANGMPVEFSSRD